MQDTGPEQGGVDNGKGGTVLGRICLGSGCQAKPLHFRLAYLGESWDSRAEFLDRVTLPRTTIKPFFVAGSSKDMNKYNALLTE